MTEVSYNHIVSQHETVNTTFGQTLGTTWPAASAVGKRSSFDIQNGNSDKTHRSVAGNNDIISSNNESWPADTFNTSTASSQPGFDSVQPTAGSQKGLQDKHKVELAIQKGLLLPSFRTRLCKYYSSRAPCAHGERCQFAHGVAELRVEAAIEQVVNWLTGPFRVKGRHARKCV